MGSIHDSTFYYYQLGKLMSFVCRCTSTQYVQVQAHLQSTMYLAFVCMYTWE